MSKKTDDKILKKSKDKEKKESRKYDLNEIRLLWIDSNNECPICHERLTFFSSEEKILEKHSKTKKGSMQRGQIAHMISFSEKNKYLNSFPIDKMKGNAIRGNIRNEFSDELHNKTSHIVKKDKYTLEFINSYHNLVILCTECHNKTDGMSFEDEEAVESFLDNLHNDNDENQLKKMYKLKNINQKKIGKKSIEIDEIPSFSLSDESDIEMYFETLFTLFGSESIPVEINSSIFNTKTHSLIFELIDLIQKDHMISRSNLKEISNALKKVLILNKEIKKHSKNDIPEYSFGIKFLKLNKKSTGMISIENKNGRTEIQKISYSQLQNQVKEIDDTETKWIWNFANAKDGEIESKPEYIVLKDLLIEAIKKYADLKKPLANFESFSVAYMARWGTGKTTIIRKLASELKDNYNFVEINLWHIANSNKSVYTKDNFFVRTIVKEAITQLSNNPDLTQKYIDAAKQSTEFARENDVKQKMLDSLLQIPEDTKSETVFRERAKFLDQFISALTRVTDLMFNNSRKPTVFVFDDIDRIEDNQSIVDILDALVAFLNIKNSIYIIPVDEAKVMKAISNIKQGQDPYSFMNKYFNYSIRAPYIPKMNVHSIIKKVIMDNKADIFDASEEEQDKMITLMAGIAVPTYRGVKDYMNSFKINKRILRENVFVSNLEGKLKESDSDFNLDKWIMFSAAIQIKLPLLVDFLAKDLRNKDVLFDLFYGENEDESIIEKLIYSLRNNDNVKPAALTKELSRYELWSAITNMEFEDKHYATVEDVVKEILLISSGNIDGEVNAITSHNRTSLSRMKNLIVSRLQYIVDMFRDFKVKHQDNMFKLIIWAMITMASIEDESVIKFAKLLDPHEILKHSDIDEVKEGIVNTLEIEEESQDNIFQKFFDGFTEFRNNALINATDADRILMNMLMSIELFADKNMNFDSDVMKKILYYKFMSEYDDADVNEYDDEMAALYNSLNKKTKILAVSLFQEQVKNALQEIIDKIPDDNKDEEAGEYKDDMAYKISYFLENFNAEMNFEINAETTKLLKDSNVKVVEKFSFAFLKMNPSINFANIMPLDIDEISKDTKHNSGVVEILKYLITEGRNFSLKGIDLSHVTNENIQKSNSFIPAPVFEKEEDGTQTLIESNYHKLIKGNEDFKNLEKYDDSLIWELKNHFSNNKASVVEHSPEIILNSLEDNNLFLNESIEWIEELAKSMKKSPLEILDDTIDKFIAINSNLIPLEYLGEITSEFSLEDLIMSKKTIKNIVSKINSPAAKAFFNENYDWTKETSYPGEVLHLTTPLSEILNGNISDKTVVDVSLNEIEFIKKINLDESSKAVFNSELQSEVYRTAEYLISKYPNSNDINLISRANGDDNVIIEGEGMEIGIYFEGIDILQIDVKNVFNTVRKDALLIKIKEFKRLQKEYISFTLTESQHVTIKAISGEINSIKTSIINENNFSKVWASKYVECKDQTSSKDQYDSSVKTRNELINRFDNIKMNIASSHKTLVKLIDIIKSFDAERINPGIELISFETPDKFGYDFNEMKSHEKEINNQVKKNENVVNQKIEFIIKDLNKIVRESKGKITNPHFNAGHYNDVAEAYEEVKKYLEDAVNLKNKIETDLKQRQLLEKQRQEEVKIKNANSTEE